MNQSIKTINRLLILMILFCFILSIARVYRSNSFFFLFLNWNLFLASIPYLLSSSIADMGSSNIQKLKLGALILVWLAFFPNAPYILTDLYHLRIKTEVPKWFDIILIVSFAWTGLLLGFLSLMKIEQLLSTLFSQKQIAIFSTTILFVASFGVYLGRFLRWNTWDILNNPSLLFVDVSNRILSPISYPTTWGVTLLFGMLLNIIYWSIKLLKNQKANQSREEYFII